MDVTNQKIIIDKKIIFVDMFLPQHKLVIEYDGEFSHINILEKDLEKNKKLIEFGYQVIRLRENPLVATTSNDLLIDKKTPIKACVELVEV